MWQCNFACRGQYNRHTNKCKPRDACQTKCEFCRNTRRKSRPVSTFDASFLRGLPDAAVELPVIDNEAVGKLAPSSAKEKRPRPIRVLHVYKTFYPDSMGGLEQAIAQMVGATEKMGVQNRILSVTTERKPARLLWGEATHFRYTQSITIASNSISLSMLRDFRQHVEWADVVHYHFPWPFADLLHLLCRVRKPSILTYHSDIVRQRKLMWIYRPLMRAFLGRVNRIVATSPNYILTSEVLRCYPHKTSVIPLGLNPGSYPIPKAEALARWRSVVGEGFFLFVGVIRYYKGLHILLDAVHKSKLRVVIVGAGPIEQELRERADSMELRNVRFLGALPDEDKVALLQLSAAVVFPSHMRSEAFGVTLLEGAMFGKPLISSEIGTGTSYVNIHCETGLVVKAGDPAALRNAMEQLEANPELQVRLGQGARKRFEENFLADQMGETYQDIYRELAAPVEEEKFVNAKLSANKTSA